MTMRFSKKKSYRVSAMDRDGDLIGSVTDSFYTKQGAIYAAKEVARRNHARLGEVRVYCKDDGEYAEYTPYGKSLLK